ncbi:hypothetical protein LSH36_434g02052 [Paralvinella palmiformis]|uniref:EF-hand domain-containing protein n=1 Tax=Paralvinella palmiformis TaxID=53620 RepID=A0AAD9JCM9_9ANNE|nr:hypothetical protein LSH36_434g02052 [Paralvinella palmiformis]
MEVKVIRGNKRLSTFKSQQASYLDNINRMILADEDFEYMHVPALAQRLEIYKRKFLEFDRDNSGYLDYNEFKQMLQTIGAAKSDVTCKKLFKRSRQSTRNVLYYRDFVDMILADTLRLGVMFDEEQDIVNKVELKKSQKVSNRVSSPSIMSSISDAVRDMGVQCEDPDSDQENQHEEDQHQEDHHEEDYYRNKVDQAVQYAESLYDGQQSVFSYRSSRHSEQNGEDEEEEGNEVESEENQREEDDDEEVAESVRGIQETNDGVEQHEEDDDDEDENEDEDDDEEEHEAEEEVREVKRAGEPRIEDQITRGVERVQLLRSEAPQGQVQQHRPPSYGRLVTNMMDRDQGQHPAHPAPASHIQQMVPNSEHHSFRTSTELYPTRALLPTRTLPGGNPPPVVCSTRDLPPEATTKAPVAVSRPAPAPAPYTYVCTDPSCPDSYPKPPQPAPPPLCTDPNCPYNRASQPMPPMHYQQYVQPVEFEHPEAYVDYEPMIPMSQMMQNPDGTCPHGHRCVSPQPGYEMVPIQSGPPSVSYGYPAQPAYTLVPDLEQRFYGNHMDEAYAHDVRVEYEAQPYYMM